MAVDPGKVAGSDFFKAIFTGSPIPCLFFGTTGILDCNEAAVRLLGATDRNQIVGMHPALFSPPLQPDGMSSQGKSVAMDALARQNGSHTFEWTHRKVDGEDFPVEVTLTPIEFESEIILLTQWRDLTFEKKSAAEIAQLVQLLKTREEYYRNIFEHSPLGIIELDTEFHFISANNAYLNILGYTEEELRSLTMIFLTLPEDRPKSIDAANSESLANGKILSFEKRYLHKSGKVVWAQVTAKFIRPPSGRPRYVAIIADITSEKEKETELLQMKEQLVIQESKAILNAKLASLGQMAGSIAHEINNPLAIIRGKAQQIKRKINDNELTPAQSLEFIEAIESTGERMIKIVKGLTLLVRSGEGDPLEETLVSELLDDTVALCREKFRGQGIKFNVEADSAALETVACARVQIGQVFLNILNNAFDAVQGTDGPWIEFAVSSDEKNIRFTISNSGKKIAADLVDKIMQPFFTTKEIGKGTGLGLSISQKIIESHGGTLKVDLERDHTSFVINLPRIVAAT